MNTIDKSTWGQGPWASEPDSFTWNYRGLKCAILRTPEVGHLCGYVVIPESHTLYRKSYSLSLKITPQLQEWAKKNNRQFVAGMGHFLDMLSGSLSLGSLFAVHGGVTWADFGIRGLEGWSMGFDCGHSTDFLPGLEARMQEFNKKYGYASGRDASGYKTFDYVKAETESLADQILSFDFEPEIQVESEEDFIEEPEVVEPTPTQIETLPTQTETLPMFEESLPTQTETLPMFEESLPTQTETLPTHEEIKRETIVDQPKKFQKAEDNLFFVDPSEMYH